jgi:uncharacterized membrane protein
MDISYDRIAGQSKERLAAISDGIFGVAMTLMLLELHTPLATSVHGEWDLLLALRNLGPAFLVYLMSFITLGIYWLGQQTQINHLDRSDRNLTWLHLAFLFGVTILPLSTRLLTEFIWLRVALLFYWLNILLLGTTLHACWRYAEKTGLVSESGPEHVKAAICRRIVSAQIRYAIGAALCVFSTYLSIGFIVLVQLNYVIAPRMWLTGRPGADAADADEE